MMWKLFFYFFFFFKKKKRNKYTEISKKKIDLNLSSIKIYETKKNPEKKPSASEKAYEKQKNLLEFFK